MEGRMEVLEGMVKKLQKTVNNLRRRIRTISSFSEGCRDDKGHKRTDGEEWQANPCTACECQVSGERISLSTYNACEHEAVQV